MSEPATKKARTSATSSMPPTTVDAGVSAIPISRVNKIIKADRDVRICSKEAVFLIAKATELMLGKVTTQAYQNARMDKRQKMVRYTDLSAAIHTHPAWFYLGEVIPSAMPLSAALALRQANEDLASKPSAVTTAAPAKKFDGKRVVKNKGGKGAKVAPVGGLPQTAAGGWEGEGVGGELGKRKTRGKKLKLPVGEGGEGSEGSEFGGSDGAEGDDAYDDAAMEV